jgi:hypothetical protein
MSIEEFRAYGGFVEPPIVHWPHQKLHVVTVGSGAVTETTNNIFNDNSKTTKARRMNDIETSTTETNTLKLKRNKPLQRSDSKLENILGITRKVKEKECSSFFWMKGTRALGTRTSSETPQD